MASTIAVERRGDAVWCALDRPPLNLFEPGLITALRTTFETLARDTTIRATVLAGRGRAFTAGMDVRVLHGLNPTSARALITDLCAAIDAVHRAPFPVLAAVHGACLGAGFELALACDLRLAAADASFGLPEVRVGVPSVIQAALLPPVIGPGRAAEMLLLGTRVDAPRALAWGLVNRVVERAALAAAVEETLAALLACAPGAVRAQKALMIRWRESDVPVQDHVRAIVGAIDRDLPARLPADVLAALVNAYARPILMVPPTVDDGALDALRKLSDLGYTLAVVSNTMRTPGATLRRVLEHFGLLGCFSHTAFSDETGVRKPDPAIFLGALRALGAEPAHAIHVGDDAILDVEGARAAGMRVVQVTSAALKASGARRPDAVVSSLAALPDAIARLDAV